jgi:hypothetical protein
MRWDLDDITQVQLHPQKKKVTATRNFSFATHAQFIKYHKSQSKLTI